MKDEAIEILKEIKTSLSVIIGTDNMPTEKQFSKEALDKAAKEFGKLKKESGQWIRSYNIVKYIKSAPYNNAGNFISKITPAGLEPIPPTVIDKEKIIETENLNNPKEHNKDNSKSRNNIKHEKK